MTLTAQDIESALEEHNSYFYWGELTYSFSDTKLFVGGVGYDVEVVETHDDDQEWAYNTWVVFKVGEQVFRKTGYYRSHDGEYWDGPLVEVVPSEKTVIVWEPK